MGAVLTACQQSKRSLVWSRCCRRPCDGQNAGTRPRAQIDTQEVLAYCRQSALGVCSAADTELAVRQQWNCTRLREIYIITSRSREHSVLMIRHGRCTRGDADGTHGEKHGGTEREVIYGCTWIRTGSAHCADIRWTLTPAIMTIICTIGWRAGPMRCGKSVLLYPNYVIFRFIALD